MKRTRDDMKTYFHTLTTVLVIAFSLGLGVVSATAEFEKSDDKLFIGWLDIALDLEPGTDFGAYAIVQSGGKIYR